MKGSKRLWGLLAVVLVPLCVWVGMGATPFGWNNTSDVDISIDILNGTTTNASTQDSTACFQWAERFTVTVGPGYNDTSYFAVGRVTGGYGDSTLKRIYIRGWTTPQRGQLISVTPLWSYAAPFAGIRGAKPMANLWASITNGMADSCTRYIVADKQAFHLAGGVTTFDSTSYYYGDGRNKTVIYVPYAPYYDIVAADTAAASGKNGRHKITVVSFKGN